MPVRKFLDFFFTSILLHLHRLIRTACPVFPYIHLSPPSALATIEVNDDPRIGHRGNTQRKGSRIFVKECGPVLTKLKGDYPHLKFLQGLDGKYLNMESSLVRAAVVLLISGQDEAFFSAVQATTNFESAGALGEVHNWHLMLPTSATVSPLTYSAVVATRYVELCVKL